MCVFFGFRAPGGKKARQEATARKGRKEGSKEGGQEGRKEGRKEGGQEGRKEGRKKGGRAGRKEGRKKGGRAGRKEGRKEGTVFLFTSALETLAATVLFLLNPEPKPYGPKALNHLTP